MSDPDLYEIARNRIDRRNRRWRLWAINLAGLIIVVGAFILIVDTPLWSIGLFAMLAWIGQFVLHTITLGMAESRDDDIEKEVAKLRDAVYEKPKRLELSDDGELIELETDEYEENSKQRLT
jgi:hypothetical protein